MKVALLVIVASIASSFTDWFFMGVLFHDRYRESPDLWRSPAGTDSPRVIVYSQIVGIVSCAALTYLCIQSDPITVPGMLRTTILVWLAGPVVVITQMVLWTKLHPLIGLSHTLGWLARFVVTGLLAVWWL